MLTRFCAALFISLTFTLAPLAADWDHVHLVAPDTLAAATWYADTFHGEVMKSGPFDAVLFGKNLVKFRKGDATTKPSLGSVIDHIGFSVPDVTAAVAEVVKAGATETNPPRRVEAGGFSYAFVQDPWGTKIELIDDKDTPGFHHVHLMSRDPEKTAAWFAEVFGGEVVRFKGLAPLPGIKYGDTWLLVGKAGGDLLPSEGCSIDHIGFSPDDFANTADHLKKLDTTFATGPQKSGDHMMAFVIGPDGTKIEVVGKPEN